MESIERVLDEHKALIRKAIEDELDKRIRKEVSKRLTEYRQIAEYLRPEVTRKVLYAMMERKEELVAKLSKMVLEEVSNAIRKAFGKV